MHFITRRLLAWSLKTPVSSLDRKLLRDLWRLKGQGLAIAAVVAAGIALLVATFGCMSSLQLSMDAFYERYRFGDIFVSLKRAPSNLAERLSTVPGISELHTRVVAGVTLDMPGLAEPAAGRLISMPEGEMPRLNGVDLLSGRFVNRSRPDEALISEAFATAHKLRIGDHISATINGKKRQLHVVGIVLSPEYVYSLAPGQFMPDNRRFGVIWMGRTALAAAFDLEEAFNDVVATLQHGASEPEVLRQVDEILRPYGGLGAYARKDQLSHFFLSNELKQLSTMGAIAPPIFLAVAAFLLNIVVSRIVASERELIGLLKAFGYSNWDVSKQYLKLVLVMMSIGLILGCVGGVWLGGMMVELYDEYFKFPLLSYRLNPSLFASAALFSVLAAVAGGAAAVLRAARLSPAIAMAPPLPTSYRRSRLSFFTNGFTLSQPTRMIFRHLTRWPVRTGFTSLGIAFAVATLIASLFFMDTARYVISVVFFAAERQTLTISFVEPRAAIVERQIQRLPGVLSTQPVRAVSARIRNGPHVERTAITGIADAPHLSRLLDSDVRPVEPPPGGLALSRHLAERLNVRLGDVLTVEVMQERRPVVQMPVTRIVEQHMGFTAFMNIDALADIMHEGPTVTGIHVLADQAEVSELYRRLKLTPMVSSVSLTAAARTGFQETMENTMYVMVGFYVAFATLIAFGVTYNSARIAFSERARSLASLRVLGFTRAEVAYILLGELALQTFLALPLGCLLGYGLAWTMSPILKTDMYEFPLIIDNATYGFSVTVVLISAITCAILIAKRVYRLDLVSVLKTRE